MSYTRRRITCLIVLVAVTVSFGQTNTDQKKTVSILFIGNSLTYYNNLPELVKQNAKKYDLKVKYEMVAKPNYAIVDHWAEGKVQKLITMKKFDYVILQQGPSSQNEGRQMLIESGKNYRKRLLEVVKMKGHARLLYC